METQREISGTGPRAAPGTSESPFSDIGLPKSEHPQHSETPTPRWNRLLSRFPLRGLCSGCTGQAVFSTLTMSLLLACKTRCWPSVSPL